MDSNSIWISPKSISEGSPSSNSNSTILTPIDKEALQPVFKKLRHLSQPDGESQHKSVIKTMDAIANEVSAACTVQIGSNPPTPQSGLSSFVIGSSTTNGVAANPLDAFRRINEASSVFVSRKRSSANRFVRISSLHRKLDTCFSAIPTNEQQDLSPVVEK